MVDKRAHACASRYRHKLRRLHISHTDYNLDTVKRSTYIATQEQLSKGSILIRTNSITEENEKQILAISVV